MQRRPVIDGLEFARTGSKLQVRWPVADFPRLRDALRDEAGSIDCEVVGIPEELGRRALRLRLNGVLQLTCQRCLEALAFPLRADVTLLLAETQAEIDAEPLLPDGPERVVAEKEMQVHALAEDELLLAIPIAPRHERCAAGKAQDPATRHTPFAGLRDLMGSKH
jgi:uncharacterized protein